MLVNLVCPHCGMMFPVDVLAQKKIETPDERAERIFLAMQGRDLTDIRTAESALTAQRLIAGEIRAAIEADRESRR